MGDNNYSTNLTDQSVLIETAKNFNEYWEVRVAAVRKLTDQNVLAEIASTIGCHENESDSYVRVAAVKRITDQSLLAGIALRGDLRVVWAVVRNEYFTDQSVLAKIATREFELYESEYEFRMKEAAVEKITDQSLLEALATGGTSIRGVVVKRLSNPVLLSKIALAKTSSGSMRENAVANENFTDQAVLARVAKNDKDWRVQKSAVENPNLEDQVVLTEIARTNKNWQARLAAIAKLTDKEVLGAVAKNDKDEDVREVAADRLTTLETLKQDR